jgi:hypothetical protein
LLSGRAHARSVGGAAYPPLTSRLGGKRHQFG